MTTTPVSPNPFHDYAEPASLCQWYSGQQEPQPVYIELSLLDGRLEVDYSGEIGNAQPVAAHDGWVRRYPLPAIPTAAAANDLIRQLSPTAQRILDGMTQEYNERRGQYYPALSDDAVAAEAEMLAAAEEYSGPHVAAWHVDQAMQWLGDLEDITADTTDEELEELEQAYLGGLAADSEAAVACCDELLDALTEHRRELRAQVEV